MKNACEYFIVGCLHSFFFGFFSVFSQTIIVILIDTLQVRLELLYLYFIVPEYKSNSAIGAGFPGFFTCFWLSIVQF